MSSTFLIVALQQISCLFSFILWQTYGDTCALMKRARINETRIDERGKHA